MSISQFRCAGTLAAVLALSLLIPIAAGAAEKTIPAELRVVGDGGHVRAEHTQYSGSVKIKTSPKANCFGPGTAGSGKRVAVPGPTALGLLREALFGHRRVSPLLVTDAFDFGLGLCGIGGDVAPSTGFWSLRVNHVASLTGGDQTPIEKGDDVLWHLVGDFNDPPASELVLKETLPALSGEKKKIPVRVFEYADDGTRSPAAGAKIKGAGKADPTDAKGKTVVTVSDRSGSFRAVRSGAIPSNSLEVCIVLEFGCGAGEMLDFSGSGKADEIRVRGARPVHVSALGGADTVDLTRLKSYAFVECGVGKDQVLVAAGQDFVARRSCETVTETSRTR